MTTSPKESTTMSPLQERRLQTSALTRPPFMVTSPSRIISHRRHRPARAALFQPPDANKHIERRRNIDFAIENCFTSRKEFTDKWNFDPFNMKPLPNASSDKNAASGKSKTGTETNTSPKYEWKLINENPEKKALEKVLCSLVPNARHSLRLSIITRRENYQACDIAQENENTLPGNTGVQSKSLSEADLEPKPEIASISLESDTKGSNCSINCLNFGSSDTSTVLLEKPLGSVSSGSIENKGVTSESISVIANKSSGSSSSPSTVGIDLPTAVVTIAETKDHKDNTKQPKITDFACHRKRLHSEAMATPGSPPNKRHRSSC
ncbi:uncharacterized protein LOC108665422 [Hyalella azteca]|uniref:Uncharacterized protein LOC108665422 n=1 Tax=Hyalella azteca TaxID=294128 RepID=A0A8B7N354_HYAAZ|nr:uncharacterized protein LOC108665422 [Hyalella azteca]